MFGFSRQRQLSTVLTLVVAIAMVLWPVGQAMPPVPGTEAYETGSMAKVNFVAMFGVLTEDDLEVEYHDFSVISLPVREAAHGTAGWLISFLWTERLHKPPIA